MSQTKTPVGPGHREDSPTERDAASELTRSVAQHAGRGNRPRVERLIAGSIVSVLAAVMLAGSGWALWTDRVDRDGSGFVSIGTTSEFHTTTHAIVSNLRGDSPAWLPDWLFGSRVLGTARVRVTPLSDQPVFVGIARADDVSRYLAGTGYATLQSWETGSLTTHSGNAPSAPTSEASIWVASTKGSGQQTLVWKARSGDWSIVVMNADASADVAARAGVAAKVPILPWLAGGFLVAAAGLGLIGGWLLARGLRGATRPNSRPTESS